MRVIDVLRFFASLYGVPPARATALVEEWLERFRVPDYRDRKIEELSKGNQQKIQFIAAILHDPEVLIMDEPFTGLDPVNMGLLKEAFLAMRDAGKTLIFSTHQMETVEELCESIAIVDRGRVVVSGTVRDVKRAMGRRVVRLALDGDGPADGGVLAAEAGWVTELPGVRLAHRGVETSEFSRGRRDRSGPHPGRRAVARGSGHPLRDRRSQPRGGIHRARRAAGGRRGGAPPGRDRAGRPMSGLFPNAWHVARREYLVRVRSRTFVILTVLLALIGLGLTIAPVALRALGTDRPLQVAVLVGADDLASDPLPLLSAALNGAASAPGATRVELSETTDAADAESRVRATTWMACSPSSAATTVVSPSPT